jgi:hypothetical protein
MRKIAVAGGRKGGKARAKSMTAAERSASARAAVLARWKKTPPKPGRRVRRKTTA